MLTLTSPVGADSRVSRQPCFMLMSDDSVSAWGAGTPQSKLVLGTKAPTPPRFPECAKFTEIHLARRDWEC